MVLLSFTACSNNFSDTDSVTDDELQNLKDQFEKEEKAPIEILVLGDSTAQNYFPADKEIPQYIRNLNIAGWSTYFSDYFDKAVTINKLASSGTSSLSFTKDPKYQRFLDAVSEGDYVLIQFAHNDQKKSDLDRYTDPSIPLEDADMDCKGEDGTYSYQACLYRYYIEVALMKGAHPILLCPISRRDSTTGQTINEGHREYVQAIKDLATDLQIPCLDMTSVTEEFYNTLFREGGAKATGKLHAYASEERTSLDTSHLSPLGAYQIAALTADELKKEVPALKEYFLETPKEFKDPLA